MGNGNILIPLERLEDLELGINGVPIPLLKDNWVADNGAYKQTVAIDGMKDGSEPFIVLSTVDAEATDEELNAYACLEDRTIVEDGSITFFASEVPSISFTVIAKGVIASEGQAIADVTALVSKVNELESEIDNLNSDTTMLDSNLELLRGFKDMFGSSTEINDCNNAPNGSIMIAYSSAKNSPHQYEPTMIFTFGDKSEIYKWQLGLKADSISVRRRYDGTWTSWKDIM